MLLHCDIWRFEIFCGSREREKKMLVSTAQQPQEVENATIVERELKKLYKAMKTAIHDDATVYIHFKETSNLIYVLSYSTSATAKKENAQRHTQCNTSTCHY